MKSDDTPSEFNIIKLPYKIKQFLSWGTIYNMDTETYCYRKYQWLNEIVKGIDQHT